MTTEPETTSGEIILHIGTMKSGTSYIQAVLRRNKRPLIRDGLIVPSNMVPAVVNVLGRKGSSKERDSQGAWAEFLTLVDGRGDRRVLASQEFLSGATAAEAQAVVATLPKGQVKVVITNRDLLRVIPSHWQTVIKNGGTWPFPEYVKLLLSAPAADGTEHRYSRGFWRHHDVAKIIENWASAVGMDNVVLVTVPRSGSSIDELWQRFATAIGVDGSTYDTEATAKSNLSLTYPETEMLREVNLLVKKPLGGVEYRVLVNKYLANKLLRRAPVPGMEPDRPTLGEASHAKVVAIADKMIEGVVTTGVRVVGDVEDLRVPPYTGEPAAPDSAGPRERIPESVPQALAKLVLRVARLERDVERSRKSSEPASMAAEAAPAPSGGGAGARRRKGKANAGADAGGTKSGAGGESRSPAERTAARKAAKRAARRAAAGRPADDDRDFDSFETTAYLDDDGSGPGDD